MNGKEQLAKDGNGKALRVGDQIVVRGRVVTIPIAPSSEMPALIQVEWEPDAPPILDFVRSTSVKKEEDR